MKQIQIHLETVAISRDLYTSVSIYVGDLRCESNECTHTSIIRAW